MVLKANSQSPYPILIIIDSHDYITNDVGCYRMNWLPNRRLGCLEDRVNLANHGGYRVSTDNNNYLHVSTIAGILRIVQASRSSISFGIKSISTFRNNFIMSSTATVTVAASSSLNVGNGKDGKPKRLHQIPQFQTKEETRRWQLEQMTGAFRIFAKLGFADGGSGHISLRGEFFSYSSVYAETVWV